MKKIATTASTALIDAASNIGKDLRPPRKQAPSEREKIKFRLYVADHSPNSALARANLTALCSLHFPDQHEIEIVDVFCAPDRALADGVTMTPMLLKIEPLPVRKIVGPLRNPEVVLVELGLAKISA